MAILTIDFIFKCYYAHYSFWAVTAIYFKRLPYIMSNDK